jgi:hypothetical protein
MKKKQKKSEEYVAKLIVKDLPSMTPKQISSLASWLHQKTFEILLIIDGYESKGEYSKKYTSRLIK